MGLSSLFGLRGLSGLVGLRYLLRDEFITDRAAGAVNGTPAEPGPGTRVVIDTDGDALSISGGELSFSNLNSVWGNPGYWLDQIQRISGRLLKVQITPNLNTKLQRIGFSTVQNGVTDENQLYFHSSNNIFSRYNINNGVAVGAYVGGVDYNIVINLRSAGSYHFVKGGSFSEWILLYIHIIGSTANLYPNINSNDSILTADYIRIPDILWLPIPLAYDTFTRGDGALGNTETTGPDGQVTTVRAWNNRVGTTLIAANSASASVLSGGIAIATVDTGTADILCDFDLTRTAGNIGLVVRYTDSSNYIAAYHDGANAHLDKVVAGVTTPVISAAAAYAAGATMRVICDGTEFRLYYNNAQIGATSTISDAALQTGTEQGTYSTNTGNSEDVFQVFSRGTSGEYSHLDNF